MRGGGGAETWPVPSTNHNPEPGAEARGPRAGVIAAGRRRYLPCALRGTTPAAAAPRKEHHGHAAAAPELLPPGPRRRGPLRRLRRALRGRDPDAADPGGGAGLHGGAARPGLRRGMAPPPHPLRRPPEPALVRRARCTAPPRRRQDLLQARRAEPHRRAQDQRRARPDPAGQAHGQGAHHRRDRRRPARRRHRHRLRPVRPALHRVHGRDRRRAAAAQRVPHEAARRRGGARLLRRRHAQGRDERGAAPLGRACGGHLLLHRHRRRPAPLSGHGARLPERHRRGGPRADHRRRKAASPTRWSPRSAAARTRWACSSPSSTTPTSGCSASKPPAAASTAASTPPR